MDVLAATEAKLTSWSRRAWSATGVTTMTPTTDDALDRRVRAIVEVSTASVGFA
jgi:hypothetical protein